jgi:hypothetical protein
MYDEAGELSFQSTTPLLTFRRHIPTYQALTYPTPACELKMYPLLFPRHFKSYSTQGRASHPLQEGNLSKPFQNPHSTVFVAAASIDACRNCRPPSGMILIPLVS